MITTIATGQGFQLPQASCIQRDCPRASDDQ